MEAGEGRLLRYRLQLMSTAELRDTLRRTASRADRLRGPLPAGPTRRLLDTLVSVAAATDRHLAEHEGSGRPAPAQHGLTGPELEQCDEPVVRGRWRRRAERGVWNRWQDMEVGFRNDLWVICPILSIKHRVVLNPANMKYFSLT